MNEASVIKALGDRLTELPSIGTVVYQNRNYDIPVPYMVTQVVRTSKEDETLAGGGLNSLGFFQVAVLTDLDEFELQGLAIASLVEQRFPYGLKLALDGGGHLTVVRPPFIQTGFDDGVYWRTIVKIDYSATGTNPFSNLPLPSPGNDAAPSTFMQASPSSLWIVNHNLGWQPQVTILSLGGSEIDAEVTHTSANQFTVAFNIAQAGSAVYE